MIFFFDMIYNKICRHLILYMANGKKKYNNNIKNKLHIKIVKLKRKTRGNYNILASDYKTFGTIR